MFSIILFTLVISNEGLSERGLLLHTFQACNVSDRKRKGKIGDTTWKYNNGRSDHNMLY